MRRTWAIAAAIGVVLLLAGTAASFAHAPPVTSSARPAGNDWAAEIQACLPSITTRNVAILEDSTASECLTASMIHAYASADTDAFSVKLQSAMNATPELGNVCHSAAVTAGMHALDDSSDPMRALDAVARSPVCGWGMGHGILDALSTGNPTDADLRSVVLWCDGHADGTVLHGLCADGLGHLFWKASGNMPTAIKLCESAGTRNGRQGCGAGVLMEMFSPAGLGTPASQAGDKMPTICHEWEGLVNADGAVDGCYAGAAYLFAKPIQERFEAWWGSDAYSLGVSITSPTQAKIVKTLTKALEDCSGMGRGTPSCYDSLAGNSPSRFAEENPVEYAAYCANFPTASSRRICLNELARTQE